MYADSSLIRRHTVMLRFNDKERDLIEALVNYTGAEKAAYLRELALTMAVQVLHDADGASSAQELRVR
jgi:hypothetical protein